MEPAYGPYVANVVVSFFKVLDQHVQGESRSRLTDVVSKYKRCGQIS